MEYTATCVDEGWNSVQFTCYVTGADEVDSHTAHLLLQLGRLGVEPRVQYSGVTKQQHFTLCSEPAHCFFTSSKSHEVAQTGHY